MSSPKDGEAEAHPYKEHVQIYTKTHVLQHFYYYRLIQMKMKPLVRSKTVSKILTIKITVKQNKQKTLKQAKLSLC